MFEWPYKFLHKLIATSVCIELSIGLCQIIPNANIWLVSQVAKQQLATPGSSELPFYKRVLIAGGAGACGGFVGTPGDMINVRMQNDVKLPPDQRRK